jgi:hypothetical protein
MNILFEWFAQPGASDLAQWSISMFALILSGIGIFIGIVNSRRERTIQGRLLRIEEERQAHQRSEATRAKLSAYLQKTGRSNFHIVIRNDGESLARDVIITVDGKPLLKHPVIPYGTQAVTKIGPHSEIKYIAAVHSGCAPPFEIAMQWEDESGVGGKYETALT